MMPKVTRCISKACLAVAFLASKAYAARPQVEDDVFGTGRIVHAIQSELTSNASFRGCPLMYSPGNKELSTGQFRDLANQAVWSAPARAVITALENIDAAGRGVSWETSAGNSLEPNGKWIMQSPPADVFNQNGGLSGVLDLLHKKVGCARGDPGCDDDYKLYACQGSDACPNGGTCRPFTSSRTTSEKQPIYLCGQPADAIPDRFYEVIASAQSYVDIVSLEMPDGHFLTAIRNALNYLQNTRRDGTVQVRLLFGHIMGESSLLKPIAHLESQSSLKILLRDILPKGSYHLRVVSGTLRYFPDSWNHAKIVAADGKRMIQGGINFWQQDYLEHDPVFDIDMEISGPAAAAGSRFIDSLWESVCVGMLHEKDLGFAGGFSYFPYTKAELFKEFQRPRKEQRRDMMEALDHTEWQQQAVPKSRGQEGGSVKGITIGRMGVLGSNSADPAFAALLQSAKRSIKISAQDLGPPSSLLAWRYDYIDAICNAMVKGAKVQIMLSNPHFVPAPPKSTGAKFTEALSALWKDSALHRSLSGDSDREGLAAIKGMIRDYGLGYTKDEVREHFVLRLAHIGAPEETIERLELFYLLEGLAAKEGKTGWGNHAKFFMVDDEVFVIGSQNLYACNLQEFSTVIDDKDAAKQILNDYWNPLWSRTKTSATVHESRTKTSARVHEI